RVFPPNGADVSAHGRWCRRLCTSCPRISPASRRHRRRSSRTRRGSRATSHFKHLAGLHRLSCSLSPRCRQCSNVAGNRRTSPSTPGARVTLSRRYLPPLRIRLEAALYTTGAALFEHQAETLAASQGRHECLTTVASAYLLPNRRAHVIGAVEPDFGQVGGHDALVDR